jgi:hypothetical protein
MGRNKDRCLAVSGFCNTPFPGRSIATGPFFANIGVCDRRKAGLRPDSACAHDDRARFPAKKWAYRLIVVGVSMGLLAVAAGVATSDLSQREVPAPTTGIANAYSGGGNLVPVF